MKNKQLLIWTSCITLLLVGLASCALRQEKPVALTVSAAAVYKDVMSEVDQLYKQEKSNVTIIYNIAGSGFLRQQIEQGAQVDIYIPGIAIEMDTLQAKGFIIPETRQDLTRNGIVLIVPKDSTLPISNFQDLAGKQVKRVALGADKVSAGIYTKQTLTFLGIYEQVRQKGVFAEQDIRQVLRYVETKNVDAGITYLTDGKLSNQVKIVAIAPENSHEPVISPAAVLKSCKNVPEAQEFIQFLKSDRVAPILEKYGFTRVR